MTDQHRLIMRPLTAWLAAVALVLAGASITYVVLRERSHPPSPLPAPSSRTAAAPAAASPAANAAATEPLADVVVPLTKEAVQRAGIVVSTVTQSAPVAMNRIPGVVEPNAYRQTEVTSLVAGRITQVTVQLGDRVRRGQTLARVYSPELAEARTRYVAARAMLEAHDRELQRTQKLVDIGAASRQELERLHAEHAKQVAEVDSARARLQLLGVSAPDRPSNTPDESATTNVPSPIDGVVTERLANVGVNIDPATRLFTIVDLSTVWVVGDLYERDLARVQVGDRASITTTAYPDRVLEGRVSYIDPRLNPETRTAKVRVEVANPRADLRLGMYTEVTLANTSGATAIMIPRSAVQNVGDRQVVYLASARDPAKFIERNVRVGGTSGSQIAVLAGLAPGDAVVSQGSFFVRAERERLGLRPTTSPPSRATPPPAPATERNRDNGQAVRVTVGEQGFDPAKLTLRAGTPARITFVRTSDKTCATEIALPALNIRHALPLNQPVAVDFMPTKGELAFVCGMNMLRGVVMVE